MSSQPIGVLVAALGTPDAPTPEALRPYLKQFLSDRRVIDLHPLLWQPILRLVVLRRRPARSAALYQRIWGAEGSPLLIHSQAQAAGLQEQLGDGYRVILGMRYGSPSIAEAMRTFEEEGINRILVFPMFPQFSCATTGSIYDAVMRAALGRTGTFDFDYKRHMPTLRFVPPYYEHPDYIDALKTTIEAGVAMLDAVPDRYLFSFHGIPQRYVDEGDPYREQCEATAARLADAMGLEASEWTMAFQSQFGREPWLQPYTDEVLRALGGDGVHTLVAACPGFTADCLETLDEVGHEGQIQFTEGGGETFRLTPCLNSHPAWIAAMAEIVREETPGWKPAPERQHAMFAEAAL